MTGVQVYMIRVDGEDAMIAATSMIEALDADYRRWLEECESSDDDVDTSRSAYDFMVDQVIHVGEIELCTGSAVGALIGVSAVNALHQVQDPICQALNEGDGVYRP